MGISVWRYPSSLLRIYAFVWPRAVFIAQKLYVVSQKTQKKKNSKFNALDSFTDGGVSPWIFLWLCLKPNALARTLPCQILADHPSSRCAGWFWAHLIPVAFSDQLSPMDISNSFHSVLQLLLRKQELLGHFLFVWFPFPARCLAHVYSWSWGHLFQTHVDWLGCKAGWCVEVQLPPSSFYRIPHGYIYTHIHTDTYVYTYLHRYICYDTHTYTHTHTHIYLALYYHATAPWGQRWCIQWLNTPERTVRHAKAGESAPPQDTIQRVINDPQSMFVMLYCIIFTFYFYLQTVRVCLSAGARVDTQQVRTILKESPVLLVFSYGLNQYYNPACFSSVCSHITLITYPPCSQVGCSSIYSIFLCRCCFFELNTVVCTRRLQ